MTPFFGNVIGGTTRPAVDGARLTSVDPVTGEPWAEAADSGAADVDDACAAAVEAFRGWRRTTPRERMDALLAAADLLAAHADELGCARGARHREAAAGGRHRRDPADAGPGAVLRRRGPAARGPRGGGVRGGADVGRAPRAGGRVRRHHAVELPVHDGGLEVGTRDRGRQHDGAQAVGAHARRRPCGPPSCSPACCHPACSTSSAAVRRPVPHSRPIPRSRRSR